MSIDLKKAAKLALGAGAAYMAVKDPEGALQVAGDLAGDATKQREELIDDSLNSFCLKIKSPFGLTKESPSIRRGFLLFNYVLITH